MGKLLLIGGVLVGAGVLVVALANSSGAPQTGGNVAFGMALYGGAPGANGAGRYGLPMYGGFSGSQGYWKPSMLEGNNQGGTS